MTGSRAVVLSSSAAPPTTSIACGKRRDRRALAVGMLGSLASAGSVGCGPRGVESVTTNSFEDGYYSPPESGSPSSDRTCPGVAPEDP